MKGEGERSSKEPGILQWPRLPKKGFVVSRSSTQSRTVSRNPANKGDNSSIRGRGKPGREPRPGSTWSLFSDQAVFIHRCLLFPYQRQRYRETETMFLAPFAGDGFMMLGKSLVCFPKDEQMLSLVYWLKSQVAG